MSLDDQIVAIFAVTNGFADDVPVNKVTEFEAGLLQHMRTAHPDVGQAIMAEKDLTDSIVERLKSAIEEYKHTVSF